MHYTHTSADAHVHTCKVTHTHTRRKPRSRGKKYGRVRAHEELRKRRKKKLRLSTGGSVKEERPLIQVSPGKGPDGGVLHAKTRECALGSGREHG